MEEEGSGSTLPKRSVEKGRGNPNLTKKTASERDSGQEDSEGSERDSLLTDEARASYLS